MPKLYNSTPPDYIGVKVTSAPVNIAPSDAAGENIVYAAWVFEDAYAAKFDDDSNQYVPDEDYGPLINLKYTFPPEDGEPGWEEWMLEIAPDGYGIAVLPYGGIVACLPESSNILDGIVEIALTLTIGDTEYKYLGEDVFDGGAFIPGQTGTAIFALEE